MGETDGISNAGPARTKGVEVSAGAAEPGRGIEGTAGGGIEGTAGATGTGGVEENLTFSAVAGAAAVEEMGGRGGGATDSVVGIEDACCSD